MSTTTGTNSELALRDGARLHYRDSGAGAPAPVPVILLHGWGASGDFFERQTALAGRGLRLIVPDLRGHGRSPGVPGAPLSIAMLAADLRELIAHLELGRYSLVGWSMGAMVAWEHLRGDGLGGLDKLSVVDMTAKIVTDAAWSDGLTGGYPETMVAPTAAAVRANWGRLADISAAKLFARGASPDPALLARLGALMRANAAEGLAQLWTDMARQDYRALLPALGERCQYIYGKESRLYAEATFHHLARMTGTTQLVGLAGAGHAPQWEQPEAFGAALLRHLAADRSGGAGAL
ncbi:MULTISPECIES: alpha/beta fold hydrolase [unclassified Janthinobacterium]|uniref:alpha/beta fold hydrolase n=1 Tax=unclassified Janthinobacterium TaxID=2610881 RepID=UPI000348D078|nr:MULTISPECIES: alpha/beta hydrolase [unclassified Janthinobacterium]MEC5163323.1 pimeloyl-ACP methyl ester carboxylesterase [Janthinobacterium sp. CG_S6]